MAKINVKHAIRIAILVVGLVGTFVAASIPPIPVADGGPIWMCPPGTPHCQVPPIRLFAAWGAL